MFPFYSRVCLKGGFHHSNGQPPFAVPTFCTSAMRAAAAPASPALLRWWGWRYFPSGLRSTRQYAVGKLLKLLDLPPFGWCSKGNRKETDPCKNSNAKHPLRRDIEEPPPQSLAMNFSFDAWNALRNVISCPSPKTFVVPL